MKTNYIEQAIVILAAVLVAGGIVFAVYRWHVDHPCIRSHQETQYQAPPTIVVGGGKYGGGVGIPIGNLKPVQVTVCDERK